MSQTSFFESPEFLAAKTKAEATVLTGAAKAAYALASGAKTVGKTFKGLSRDLTDFAMDLEASVPGQKSSRNTGT